MKILLVDDERITLRFLERILGQLCPSSEIYSADNYKDALEYADEDLNVAFLDIEMPGMNGVELARKLLEVNPKLNVIFVTAYEDYALEAYQLHASGYVTKPIVMEDIRKELTYLRYPMKEDKLRVQCFGKFEVFLGTNPFHFERSSAKEVFAYLVHLRGASATRAEICSVLWEDSEEIDKRKGYFRSIMASLRKNLREVGMEEILISNNYDYALRTELLDCDYYKYLDGENSKGIKFLGEYMSQYSWAEEAIGPLMEIGFTRTKQ